MLELRSILPIKKGEEIYTRYTPPQLTSLRRQFLLQSQWYFSCDCRRCQDATECGTMGNTINCCFNHDEENNTKKHFMLPKNPRDLDSKWTCITDITHVVESKYPKDLVAEVESYIRLAEMVNISIITIHRMLVMVCSYLYFLKLCYC